MVTELSYIPTGAFEQFRTEAVGYKRNSGYLGPEENTLGVDVWPVMYPGELYEFDLKITFSAEPSAVEIIGYRYKSDQNYGVNDPNDVYFKRRVNFKSEISWSGLASHDSVGNEGFFVDVEMRNDDGGTGFNWFAELNWVKVRRRPNSQGNMTGKPFESFD